MWKKSNIHLQGSTADQAMVDFETDGKAGVLEWSVPLDLNTPIQVGEAVYFSGDCRPCAGKIHVALMAEKRLSMKEREAEAALANMEREAVSATASVSPKPRKGK